ncbi:hypothetical protein IscW_ISCW002640 [Ixodes scapularis]|uniref:Uncharacterized protein n=1 Tax=Ixodes scapularis TaxID=6945 RepID=B7PCM6_IXOSC|nr:hypothetical protein IscW_ISCW002640 [Ixodes scapularis]|eukprot:XP_002410022.1 hypothetical protein IscW_ISCW002640 [Ixodes scapularis]
MGGLGIKPRSLTDWLLVAIGPEPREQATSGADRERGLLLDVGEAHQGRRSLRFGTADRFVSFLRAKTCVRSL